jgi:hypothetical protein
LAERIISSHFQIHGFCRFNRNTLFFHSSFYDRGCSAKMDIGSKFPGIASLNGGNNFTVYYKTANVFTIRFFNEFLTNILAFKL